MTVDAQLPPNPAIKSGTPTPLWATLKSWWSPAAHASADTELGYESALPWTLCVDTPADDEGAAPY